MKFFSKTEKDPPRDGTHILIISNTDDMFYIVYWVESLEIWETFPTYTSFTDNDFDKWYELLEE